MQATRATRKTQVKRTKGAWRCAVAAVVLVGLGCPGAALVRASDDDDQLDIVQLDIVQLHGRLLAVGGRAGTREQPLQLGERVLGVHTQGRVGVVRTSSRLPQLNSETSPE